MKKLYSVDEHRDYRKVRPEIVAASVFLLLALASALYITYDLRKNQTVINESNNVPVLGEISSVGDDYKKIETDDYIVEIPENWNKVTSPQVTSEGGRFYPDRYQGTSGDDVGRILDVYHDFIPSGLEVTRILEVSIEGNQINPIDLSPQCRTFTDTGDEENPAGNPYPSKWSEIDFICRTSLSANVVAARQRGQNESILFDLENGQERFLLIYTDHGSSLNNSIFFEILKSFEAK